MVCKKCGISIPDGKDYCDNCGLAECYSSLENSNKSVRKENIKKWIGVIFSVLFFVLIFSSKIYRLIQNRSTNQNNQALEILNQGGDKEEAIKQLDKAKDLSIDDDSKITALMNKAYIYVGEEKDDLAKKSFEEALGLTKNESYEYYLISGEIASLDRNVGIAFENYQKAYGLNPNDYLINNSLGLFYLFDKEDYAKGLEFAKRAEELSDKFSKDTAKENLAIANYFNENYDEALNLFLSFDLTKKPYLYTSIAYCYLQKNDEENARIYFQKSKDVGETLTADEENFLLNKNVE